VPCGLSADWRRPHNATNTACSRGRVASELGSRSMTDFQQCWLQHVDDSGAASPDRPQALLVTRPEAARILSLSVPEIDNLRRAGRLLAKRHGQRVLSL
jgi:hypothetical protein